MADEQRTAYTETVVPFPDLAMQVLEEELAKTCHWWLSRRDIRELLQQCWRDCRNGPPESERAMPSDELKSTLDARLTDALRDIAAWQSTGLGALCREPRPSYSWRRASMQKLAAMGLVERHPWSLPTDKLPGWQITDAGWRKFQNG